MPWRCLNCANNRYRFSYCFLLNITKYPRYKCYLFNKIKWANAAKKYIFFKMFYYLLFNKPIYLSIHLMSQSVRKGEINFLSASWCDNICGRIDGKISIVDKGIYLVPFKSFEYLNERDGWSSRAILMDIKAKASEKRSDTRLQLARGGLELTI